MHFLPSELVTIIRPKTLKESVSYTIAGLGKVESCNMIHIKNFSYDGIEGVSTLRHARNTLGLALDSDAHAAGFFKGGANLAGILKSETNLNAKQKDDLKRSWQMAFSPATGTPNGVAVLEGNLSFQPITVNPTDAQLLETR